MSGLRNSPLFHAGLLGLFACVAAALLALGNAATEGAIAQRHAEDLAASIGQVVPAALRDNDLLTDTVEVLGTTVYRARVKGMLSGAAWRVTGQGYGGEIGLIMAVDPKGEILGVRVLNHAETPGLGDKIEAAKDDWITRFTGRRLGDPSEAQWGVKKDGGLFDQFSGATITPRAVVAAVKGGLQFFAANREAILAPPPPIPPSEATTEPTKPGKKTEAGT